MNYRLTGIGRVLLFVAGVLACSCLFVAGLATAGRPLFTFTIPGLSQPLTATPPATEPPIVRATSISTSPPGVSPQPTARPVVGAPATATRPPAVPTVPPGSPQVTLRAGFDSFGSYFPIVQVAQMPGKSYDLQLIPFSFNGQNDYTEAQRAAKLASGDWDILLTTMNSLVKSGDIGSIVAVVDQSAGADKVVAWPQAVTTGDSRPIARFNDLKGLALGYSDGSVGQFQILSLLRVVGISVNEVKLVPAKSVGDAVQLFKDKKVDAIAAWEPDVQGAITAGGKTLVSSEWWRNIQDVIVVSHQADTNKPAAVQAFLHDWFMALKIQQEDLPSAAKAVAAWQSDGQATGDWTFVRPDSAVDDYTAWLQTIAQAGLGANQIVMQNPDLLAQQLTAARQVWAWGSAVDSNQPFDPKTIIQPRYVLALAQDGSLMPTQGALVNPTYQPVAPALPSSSADQLIQLPTIAELPCKKFTFLPDSPTLAPDSLPELQKCAEAMIQMTRVSDVRILVTGWSAWPGPVGQYSQQDIENFARLRALGVQTALVQFGVDPARIAILAQIPPQQDWNAMSESQLEPYRQVVIEAKRGGR